MPKIKPLIESGKPVALGVLAWDAYAAAADETVVVDSIGYSNLAVFSEVDAAADITLDAVSQDNINFRTIDEVVHSYGGADSAIDDLNDVITTKAGAKYRYLRFKVSAIVTISLEITGKHQYPNTILGKDEAGLFKTTDFTEVRDIAQVGGTSQTSADWTPLFQNLDIALSALRDEQRGFFEPKSNYNSSAAAALTVDLDTGLYGGRTNVEVWVKSSAAADFDVQGSTDGTNWRTVDTLSLGAAGETHSGYSNAYRYIRVTTSAANDSEIEIAGSR